MARHPPCGTSGSVGGRVGGTCSLGWSHGLTCLSACPSRWTCRARNQRMPHTTILFVHLQYDAPNSPQSRALRALAATVAPPLYLVGGYAYDDFDTDSLPLAVAQAVRDAHQARIDTAVAGQLQAHVAALTAEQVAVTPLLRAGAPQT